MEATVTDGFGLIQPVEARGERPSAPPGARWLAYDGAYDAAAPGAAPKIQIPRWIQLVGLPVLLILAWVVAGRVFHVVFLFLVASLVALLFNPIVKAISGIKLGRLPDPARRVGLGGLHALRGALDRHRLGARDGCRRPDEDGREPVRHVLHGRPRRTGQTDADRDVDRLQHWLDTHGLKSIKVQERGHRWVKQIREKDVGKYTHKVVNFVEGAAISIGKLLFAGIVILVVSIYMLLDLSRLGAAIDRRFPPRPGSEPLLARMEEAVVGYVKGQLLVSLIIGASAGFGMWLLGALGWVPGADKYALLFGAWVAVTELIPYLGPVARRDPGGDLRGRGRPDLGDLGDDPVPDHPSGRGPHRRSERDGKRAQAAPAAGDLRPACRRRDLRSGRDPRRTAAPRRRPGGVRVLLRARRARAVERRPGADRGRGRAAASACAAPAERVIASPLLAARDVSRSFGDHVALQPTSLAVGAGEVLAPRRPERGGQVDAARDPRRCAFTEPPARSSSATASAPGGCRSGRRTTGGSPPARTSSCSPGSRGSATRRRCSPGLELPDDGRPAVALSVGNRQRLDLAISLLGDPQVLLLDEPTAALDLRQRRRFWETAATVRDEGGAVVLVTQNVDDLEHVVDRVTALIDGPSSSPAASPSTCARRLRERCGEGAAPDPPKDLLVLRRSPALLGVLLAYPLVIALLIGLTAAYANAKPRVALVDLDGIPARVTVAGQSFDVDGLIGDVAKNVEIVRMSEDQAARQLRSGRVAAVVTVPKGFVAELKGLVSSPHLTLATGTGGITPRVRQQMQALVYNLNRKLQSAFIQADLQYVNLLLHGGERHGARPPVLDHRPRGDGASCCEQLPPSRAEGEDPGLRPRRPARARAHGQCGPRDRARRSQLDEISGRRPHVGAVRAGAGVRPGDHDHLPRRPARGRCARRRAGRERDRPARPRARRARPARRGEDRARRRRRPRARSRAPARVRDRGRDRRRPRRPAVAAPAARPRRAWCSPAPRSARSAR